MALIGQMRESHFCNSHGTWYLYCVVFLVIVELRSSSYNNILVCQPEDQMCSEVKSSGGGVSSMQSRKLEDFV